MAKAPFIVVFPLFPGLTHLDLSGPHEVFARLPDVQLLVAAREAGSIESASGLVVGEVGALGEIPRCDLICVPGGPGVDAALEDEIFLREVRRLALCARYVTSVCTGSLILGATGFLDGKRATSHWNSIDFLPEFGAIPVRERVVQDGNLITGGGVTAGLDFALKVVAEIASPETAQATQLSLEYAPEPPFSAGHPDTAPPEVRGELAKLLGPMLEARRLAVGRAVERRDRIIRMRAERKG